VEYFADPDGARTLAAGGAKNLAATNFTVTPSYVITEGVLIRAEYRYDTANKKIWFDDAGKAEDNASTVGLQFIGQF
jgi:hypothetical protein